MRFKQRLANWLTDTKASTTSALVSLGKLGRAVWTPRQYGKLAEEAYVKNVVAYKCINEIMTAMSQVPWLVQRVDSSGNAMDAGESALAGLLRRPNPEQSGPAFVSMFTGFYLVSGNSYIEGVYAQASQPPKELYTLRPDRMSVIAGENGPAGYEYKVAGVSRKWVGDEKSYIRHIKTFHPTDDWYGLSPIEAAAFDIDVHNATLEWNKALLDNRAQPSGALSYKPTRDTDPSFLDDAKYARLKQELDSHIGSSGNAGRPLLLEGGLEWQSMSFSPQDMDYINSKNTTARDIAMAYGVPAQLLGIPGDNTYNNMGEARVALWEQTVLPLAYLLRDELNAWLAPQFGPEYYITIDEDAILALAPRRAAKWQQLQSADFLTTNEKREALGYEPVAGGDQVLAPANLLPIAYTTEPTGDEGAAETEKDFASWLVREEGYTEEKAATLAALAFEEQQ